MKKQPDNGSDDRLDPFHPANCINPRAVIEMHLNVALAGLKWLKENVRDEKTYGNGVEDDVIKTLSDFNDEMQRYFGMAKWGHTEPSR
ncbi:MAG: hypothetical protein ACRETA_13060 [Gammaproteobacteria bacterium]